jgi:hypothetical protein
MVLQSLGWNAHALGPGEESRSIGGHEVRHWAPHPDVPVQPESAVHCVNHAVAAQGKLHPLIHQRRGVTRRRDGRNAKLRASRQWQLTTPSGSPGYGGDVTMPEKTEHVSGKD